MKTGIIKSHNIAENSMRVDPSFFLSEGVKVRAELSNCPHGLITVDQCAEDVFYGNIFSRIFVKDAEHGSPYLAASDTVLANLETGYFLANRQAKELEYLFLKKDWIVVTCSGTVGNVTYTNANFENHIATHDLIRIVPNDNHVNRGCLYAFLAGKYGYYQLTQSQYGGVVKHINEAHINSIKIPLFPEDFQFEINSQIKEVARLREEAKNLLSEAHRLIEEKFFFEESPKQRKVSFSEIIEGQNQRFDGSFHLADADCYIEQMKDFGYDKLIDLCTEIFSGGRAKRYYTDDTIRGVPFFSNGDLSNANPLRSCKYALKTRVYDLKNVLKAGMITTGRVGAIGQTTYIGKHFEDASAIGSDNVIRIVPRSHSGYIYAFLSSKIGNALFWKYSTGGVQPFITPGMIEELPIAKFDDIISKVDNLMSNYIDKQELACVKESHAIASVEQIIESWSK